jgi:sugar lactone lactonase YvrE
VIRARSLADRQPYPSSIALDGDYVYWTSAVAGAVLRVSKRGGSPVALAADLGCPLSLAVDELAVFVTLCEDYGAIVRIPKRGGEPEPIAPGEVFPACLALDRERVYWTAQGEDRDSGRVCSATKAGGDLTVLAEGQAGPDGIGVDQAHVYWLTRDDYVHMAPKAGGRATVLHRPHEAVEELLLSGEEINAESSIPRSGMISMHRDASPPAVRRLALDEETVYWQSAAGGVARVGSADADRPASRPLLLAIDRSAPGDVAADPEWIYWVEHREGRVMRVPRVGGRPRVFAEGEPGAISIAVDEEAVYWAVAGTAPAYMDGAVRSKRKSAPVRPRRR